jgi:hypothetical protein
VVRVLLYRILALLLFLGQLFRWHASFLPYRVSVKFLQRGRQVKEKGIGWED